MKEFKTLEVNNICEIETEHEEPTIYKLKLDDTLTLSGLYHISNNTDKIVVFFNGATTGELTGRSNFMRWSWGYKAGISFISFDDPVVSCTKLTNLGWYIGTKNIDVQEVINEILQHIIESNNIAPNRVVFYGSSGGGFAAIMAAIRLRGSIAVAINPQTNIFKYHKKSHEKIINNFFSPIDLLDNKKMKAIERFSTIESIRKSQYIPNILYIQNTQDAFHLNNHYIPFHDFYMKMTRDVGTFKNRLHIRLFNHEDGHSSISDKNEFLNEVSFALENLTDSTTESVSTGSPLDKVSLSDKAHWINIEGAIEESYITISISLSNLCSQSDTRPAILLFECHDYSIEKLKEIGLGYSDSFGCAFRYINITNNETAISLKVKNSTSIQKIGIRRWKSTNPPILDCFTIKYDRELSFLSIN
ncbi:alpha/beta hydrolase family protein [Aeromonas salmonicida]|uniref:alpha/beta hydrolase family protein n=1 Tax=Aeromonas salmonicida TaxID=645 RepID=UPI0038BC7F8B